MFRRGRLAADLRWRRRHGALEALPHVRVRDQPGRRRGLARRGLVHRAGRWRRPAFVGRRFARRLCRLARRRRGRLPARRRRSVWRRGMRAGFGGDRRRLGLERRHGLRVLKRRLWRWFRRWRWRWHP
ncbi:MAG: hypothetical protein M5R40_19495 [Anaerolineae bacterium]|nr:hypothetical protein [Anaerolineae bacterium]